MKHFLVNLFLANLAYCMHLEDSDSTSEDYRSFSSSSEIFSGPEDWDPTAPDFDLAKYKPADIFPERFLPPASDHHAVSLRCTDIPPSSPEPLIAEGKLSITGTEFKLMEACAPECEECVVDEPEPMVREFNEPEPKMPSSLFEFEQNMRNAVVEFEQKEREVVTPEPIRVRSREPVVLHYLEESLLLASGQGDSETIKLIIDIGKLEPILYTALMTALKHNHNEVALLIASHLSCRITADDFEAVRLGVANNMDIELILMLLKGNHGNMAPRLQDAVMLCITKGLVDVLEYLAVYYEHPGKRTDRIPPRRAMFEDEVLGRFINSACASPAPLATLEILLASKSPFSQDVLPVTKLKLLQKAIFAAHTQGKLQLRNLLIKYAMKSYKKFKKQDRAGINHFRRLASVLDAAENIQYMMLIDTGMNILPNDIRRVIFDIILDKAVDKQQREEKQKKAVEHKKRGLFGIRRRLGQ